MERREFVEVVSATLAGAMRAGRWTELTAASAFAANLPLAAPYEFLTPHQARLLDVVTAHLVPTDDTPGAREANVVRFMDHALATFFEEYQKDFAEMLDGFVEFTGRYRPDNVPFLEMSASEQVGALRDLERLSPDVFGPMRGLTMLGMFSHPEHGGNYRKIGWKLIGYQDQYSWAPPFGYYDRA
jgi:hypothetical protein